MDSLCLGYLYIHIVNILVAVGFRSNSSQNMYILFFRKSKPSDIDPTVTVVLTAWIHNILTLGNLDPIKQFAKYAVRFRSDNLQNTFYFYNFFEEFWFMHIFNVLYRWEYFVCHLLVLFLYIITLEWQFLVSYFLELCTSNHMIGWLTCLLNLLPFSNPQKVSSTYIIHCFLFMIMLLYYNLFFFQL